MSIEGHIWNQGTPPTYEVQDGHIRRNGEDIGYVNDDDRVYRNGEFIGYRDSDGYIFDRTYKRVGRVDSDVVYTEKGESVKHVLLTEDSERKTANRDRAAVFLRERELAEWRELVGPPMPREEVHGHVFHDRGYDRGR